jgi:hypothetical protein
MKLKTLSLDIAFGGKCDQTEDFLKYLQEVCEVFQLQIVGLIPVGSGGGWPEVTFRGTEENLTKFSISFHDDEIDGKDIMKEYSRDDSDRGFYVAVDERFTTKGNREFFDEDGTSKEW